MSDSENEVEFSRYLVRSTRNSNDVEQLSKHGAKVLSTSVDDNSIYKLKELVRIEYPGLVKNPLKAIETLGGMYGIETALSQPQPRSKLELRFHPRNQFNKPCFSDRDLNPGLLIHVKETQGKIDYDVVGYTGVNFKFNKMCEFQYLPLIPAKTFSEDEVEYVHDKIIPETLPDLQYFLSKENDEQSIYALPSAFTRYESQSSLYLRAGEKFNLEGNLRPELFKMWQTKKPRNRIAAKTITKTVQVVDSNTEIPSEPYPVTLEIIKYRMWDAQYEMVKKLFEEKPMWTKIAIIHRTGITLDVAKAVLPAVGYFFSSGPWRTVWAKFGYNPLKDFNSRLYQTLDFRIRSTEGTKIKVGAKRPYSKQLGDEHSRIFLQSSIKASGALDASNVLAERSYILRPDIIPPARQMFYQFCHIEIPEIQEMFRRLPKLPSHQKVDPKNGWLPTNFIEQCREIANKYVIDRVHQELVQDSIKLQQQEEREAESEEEPKPSTSTYCSKMLNNIKKGIYTSVGALPVKEEASLGDQRQSSIEVDFIDLVDDLMDDEEVDMEDVVNSIPETMAEISDDEHLSHCSDLDIDLDVAEEINQLIEETKKDLNCVQK